MNINSPNRMKLQVGSFRPSQKLVAAAICVVGLISGLQAQTTYDWTNSSGGAWQTDANWSGTGVPGGNSTDKANLVGFGPFTITLSSNVTLDGVSLGSRDSASLAASNITLDLQGYTINALNTGAGAANSSLLARSSNSIGNVSMTITGGTFNGGVMLVGRSSSGGFWGNNSSTIRASGTTTTINMRGTGSSQPFMATNVIGGHGGAYLLIENGATLNVTHSSLTVQGSSASNGLSLLRVTGSGSNVTATGIPSANVLDRVMVRVIDNAGIEVLAQGTLTTDELYMAMGTTAGTLGTMLVSGTGSNVTAKVFFVAGGKLSPSQIPAAAAQNGLLQVNNGGVATVSENFTVYGNGTVEVDRGSITVSGAGSSALLSAGSSLNITLNTTAQAVALVVANGLTITNANLNISLSNTFTASINDVFTIASRGSLIGTFAGKADLSTFQVGGYTFRINYNDASNITLLTTAVPEPSVAACVFLGVGLLFAFRRFRRTC